MISEGRKLRKKITRGVEEQLKREHKDRIAKLRADAKRAKSERADKLRDAKKSCDVRVVKAKQEAQRAFDQARTAALAAQKAATVKRHAARKVRKQAARDKCALDRDAVKADAAAKLALTRAETATERRERREYEAAERGIRGRERRRPKATAKERRTESDDLVRDSIDRSLWPLWEERKRYVKADARRRRFEVFMDWVHDHPSAVLEAQMSGQPSDVEFAAGEAAAWAERDTVRDEVPF